jgi:YD repeat-containing protein
MKQYFTNAFAGISIVTLFLTLPACHKIGDIIHHGGGSAKKCDINLITTYTNDDSLVFSFSYNQQGNPLSILSNKTQQGLYNRHFKYDQQHRLAYYFAEPLAGQPIDFYYLHRFTYNNQNQIIIDSNYLGGTFAAVNNGTQAPVQIVHFEYDTWGRIKQTKEVNYPGSGAETIYITTYSYDANGNLVKPGVSYDNKINWAQTNNIWMFLRRDYSVNNPFTATQYNGKKLPTRLNEVQTPYTIFVEQVYYGNSVVEYDCD